MENKIYKCKRCSKTLKPKEIDLNLEFSKSVRVISDKKDVTHIPFGGIHKGCGGKVVIGESKFKRTRREN